MRLPVLFATLSMSVFAAPAFAEADGPDFWRVDGVSANDVLNVRTGPGPKFEKVGGLPANARAVKNLGCEGGLSFAEFEKMTPEQRAKAPSAWCQIVHEQTGLTGWVSQRYLAEDGAPVEQVSDDPQMDAALALVSELMTALKASWQSPAPSPLQMPEAAKYFASGLIASIDPGTLGADPIIGGQDADLGDDITVELDPDQPPLRGSYPVRATFTNFGQLRTVIFYLNVDPAVAPQMRIFSFEADGEVYQ